MQKLALLFLILTPMLVGLPLAGVAWHPDRNVRHYLEFPPLTCYIEPAPFSWPVFLLLAAGILAFLVLFLRRIAREALSRDVSNDRGSQPRRRFPWWGWCAVAFGAVAWVLAWNRFAWFAPLQMHSFTPLWVAYILTVNALTWKRSGRCMMLDHPRTFLALFPFSAGFWWFFEFLNRFVQNWYYVGIAEMTGWQYFWFATIPFATVLPAVIGTQEWLMTFRCFDHGFASGRALVIHRPRFCAGLLFGLSGFGLAMIGVWPNALFPLLWIAPLLVVLALQLGSGAPGILDEARRGDWRRLATAAVGCLICGFFWEMWNSLSLAKWIYTVPYVHVGQVFEMPVLGYAGYLPFGLECLALAELVRAVTERRTGAAWEQIPANGPGGHAHLAV